MAPSAILVVPEQGEKTMNTTLRSPGIKRVRGRSRSLERRGVAAVEFAFIAPLFVVLLVGLVQLTLVLDTYNLFSMTAREGARMALFEREGLLPLNDTTNGKLERDIRMILKAANFDGDGIDVIICHPGQPTNTFNLDDPTLKMEYFEVRIEYPFDELLYTPPPGSAGQMISTGVVFRNSPGNIVQ